MVVIEVFTPVVQRILKHNMVRHHRGKVADGKQHRKRLLIDPLRALAGATVGAPSLFIHFMLAISNELGKTLNCGWLAFIICQLHSQSKIFGRSQ